MPYDFTAVFYVKDAPEFRVEDGHMHICHTTGRMHFEFAMRPNAFRKAIRRAQEAFAEFNASGDVVGIKDGKRH